MGITFKLERAQKADTTKVKIYNMLHGSRYYR